MSETAEQRRTRLAAEQQAEAAIAWTQQMLRLGLLLPEERIVAGGLAIGPGYRETWAEHVRSLEWILTLLEQHLACVTPSWSDRATPTGISIAVPDPSRPEIVERITSTVTPRGTIFDLWRDERRRLFYLGFGRRQYVLETEGGPVF